MGDQFKIIGYHGTFIENVNKIIKEGYTYIRRDNHWLGQGIYFYDNEELAKWFITRRYRGHNKQISVIKSTLCTTSDKVLNLNINEDVDFVYEKFKELSKEINIIFDKDDEIKNRCIILDIVKEYYNIDIIIKTFETSNQSYGRVDIKWFEENYFPLGIRYSETQICATDNSCIKDSIEIDYTGTYHLPSRIWFKKR